MSFTPDTFAPYEEKITPAYGAKVGGWIENVLISGLANPAGIQGRKALAYQYATGNQTYAATIKPIENLGGTDQQTVPGADMQNIQLIPQLISNLAGKMIKTQMKPSVVLQDEMAQMFRKDRRASLEYAMLLNQQGADLSMYMNQLGITEDEVPLDLSELDIRLAMEPQFVEEMALEMGLQKIAEESKLDTLRYMICKDLITNPGRSGYYIDRTLGRRQIKKLDAPNSGIINFSMYEDGRDVCGNYFLEAVPLEKVRFDAQGQIPDEKLKQLRGGYFWQLGYGAYSWALNGMWGAQYNGMFVDMCLILHFDFTSTDRFFFNEKDGKPFPPGFKPRKDGVDGNVSSRMVQTLFEGNYICGTGDLIYNYGPVKNAIRQPVITGAQYRNLIDRFPNIPQEQVGQMQSEMTDLDSKKVYANRVYSSFVTYQPDMVEGISRSPVERTMPLIDTYIQTWQKIRDAINMYLPYFIWVNEDVLAGMVTDDNGEDLSVDDFIVTAIKRGWLSGRSGSLKFQHRETFKDAISISEHSAAPIQALYALFVEQAATIRDAFGLPTVATGAQGSGTRPGKAVTELLLQGADDTFTGLTFAEIQLQQNLYETLGWDLLHSGDAGVVGTRNYSIPSGNPYERIPCFKVEVLPTQGERDQLKIYANEEKAKGFITAGDIAMLDTFDNMKLAYAYLTFKSAKGERLAHERGLQNIKATGEEQRASNQQTHDNKIQEEKQKYVGEQQKIIIEKAGNLQEIMLKALVTPKKETDGALNLEKAQTFLQQSIKDLQEFYVGISGSSPANNAGEQPTNITV